MLTAGCLLLVCKWVLSYSWAVQHVNSNSPRGKDGIWIKPHSWANSRSLKAAALSRLWWNLLSFSRLSTSMSIIYIYKSLFYISLYLNFELYDLYDYTVWCIINCGWSQNLWLVTPLKYFIITFTFTIICYICSLIFIFSFTETNFVHVCHINLQDLSNFNQTIRFQCR